jgi:tripartite-type tricarboxylate transporter receptor subunit TctC
MEFLMPAEFLTSINRRRLLALTGAALPAAFLSIRNAEAAYAEQTVTIMVPFAPGGGSDMIARLISGPLGEDLGQTVLVKNRPGGGGNIGIGDAARAKPDGYTLLVSSIVYVLNPSLYKQIPYDPYKSFAPILDLGYEPLVIVANPNAGLKTVDDLIKQAQANPDKFNYGTPGAGSISRLAMELFEAQAKFKAVHIPYSGAGPAIIAVLGGATQLAVVALSAAIGQIKAGQLTALVQTGEKRWPDLPDVPTMGEAGFPGATAESFQCLLAPAGTPQEIVDRVGKAVAAALKKPEIADDLRKDGFGVTAAGPEELAARFAKEVPMWADVVRNAGIQPQ